MGRPAISVGQRGRISPKRRGAAWFCRVRYRDMAGVRREFNVGPLPRARDAEQAAEAKWCELRSAMIAPTVISLDDVARRWLASLESDGQTKPGSIRSWTKTWTATLSPVVGERDVNEFSRADAVESLRSLYRRRPRRRLRDSSGRKITMLVDGQERDIWEHDLRDWGSGHVKIDPKGADAASNWVPVTGVQPRSVLMMVLRFAADEGLRRDGVVVLDGTKSPRRREPSPREVTAADFELLVAWADAKSRRRRSDTNLRDLLVFLYYSGVRMGEALGLTWNRVFLDDPEAPWVLIDRQLLEDGGIVFGTTKGTRSNGRIEMRRIILHARAANMLLERRVATPWTGPEDPVFATVQSGRALSTAPGAGRVVRPVHLRHSNVRTRIRDLVKGTDLEWVHAHSFKHSLLTKADRVAGSAVAADFGGHATDAVTKRFYVAKDDVTLLDPREFF
jgi:integrase